MKSLGELGYEHFKPPIVKVFLQESIVENTIPNMKQSALEYFVYTIRERRERRKLLRYACQHYQPPEHFIWGPPTKPKAPQSQSINKITSSNATISNKSLKKPSRISKDAKTKQEQEAPRIGFVAEKLQGNAQAEDPKEETSEVHSLAESLQDKNEIDIEDVRIEGSELKHLPESTDDKTGSSPHENELKEPDTEASYNESNTDSILIVDAVDEGSKDCLCSL